MNSSSSAVDAAALFASLPPVWPEELLPALQAHNRTGSSKLVVLDDDPTGTQTVHGVRIYTNWHYATLHQALATPETTCYVLTNSRSLSPAAAAALARELGKKLRRASEDVGRSITLISRSDSTLRGHFPDETDALLEGLGGTVDATLLIPAFIEGNRVTIGDVHYIHQGDQLRPVGDSEFARDPAFGFRASNLRLWVEEKTRGAIRASDVASIELDLIRQGGPAGVSAALHNLNPGQVCVVNATCYRDLEVLAWGAVGVERAGKRLMYRSAASFVRARAGVAARSLLSRRELDLPEEGGGLIMVGSYVPTTTGQLKVLLRRSDVIGLELKVPDLLDSGRRGAAITAVASAASTAIRGGLNSVIFTSREQIGAKRPEASLETGRRVSHGLVEVLQQIIVRPRFLVAKGGVTSSDLVTLGLGTTQALVKGQIAPGVSVWELDQASRYPGLPYVVFPGNVGDEATLAEVVARLSVPGSRA